MTDILVDTNILVYCFDRKIDLERVLDDFLQQGFSLLTLKKCMDELLAIKRKDVESFFSSYKINIMDFNVGKNTDDTIIDFCRRNGCVVFTEDRNLIARTKGLGVKTISFRGKTLKFNS